MQPFFSRATHSDFLSADVYENFKDILTLNENSQLVQKVLWKSPVGWCTKGKITKPYFLSILSFIDCMFSFKSPQNTLKDLIMVYVHNLLWFISVGFWLNLQDIGENTLAKNYLSHFSFFSLLKYVLSPLWIWLLWMEGLKFYHSPYTIWCTYARV